MSENRYDTELGSKDNSGSRYLDPLVRRIPPHGWHWWHGVGNDRHENGTRPSVPQWWCVKTWTFAACTYGSAACWVGPLDMQNAGGKWGPEIIPPNAKDERHSAAK